MLAGWQVGAGCSTAAQEPSPARRPRQAGLARSNLGEIRDSIRCDQPLSQRKLIEKLYLKARPGEATSPAIAATRRCAGRAPSSNSSVFCHLYPGTRPARHLWPMRRLYPGTPGIPFCIPAPREPLLYPGTARHLWPMRRVEKREAPGPRPARGWRPRRASFLPDAVGL